MELLPLLSFAVVATLVTLAALLYRQAREHRRRWGWVESVELSPAQATAMRVLWEHRLGAPPATDPLASLSEAELAYLARISSADFRPRELGDTTNLRRLLEENCKRRGFTDQQTTVLIGMAVNGVGRPAIAGQPLTGFRLAPMRMASAPIDRRLGSG